MPSILSRFLLIITGVVLGLAPIEVITRALGLAPAVILLTDRGKPTAYRFSLNPILGYELTPNYRQPHPSNHFGQFDYINGDGHRDIERSVERIPERERILLLGDSVVAGHGLRNLEDTISRNLERVLGDGTEVLNFGVGGYTTKAEVELLRTSGLKYKPDGVILLVVDNDDDGHNGDIGIPRRVARPAWSEQLFLSSHLFRVLALRFNLYRFRSEHEGKWDSENRSAIRNGGMKAAFADLAALAHQGNFRVAVVLWPRFLDSGMTESNFPRSKKGGPPLAVELAHAHGFPVFHLMEGLAQRYQEVCASRPCKSVRSEFAPDTIHPSSQASLIAAELIAPVAKSLLSPRK